MKFDKTQIRQKLYYEFKLGCKAVSAHRNLRVAFGRHRPCERTCVRWLARFSSGQTSFVDEG